MFVTRSPDSASVRHQLDLDAVLLVKMGLSIFLRITYLGALVCIND